MTGVSICSNGDREVSGKEIRQKIGEGHETPPIFDIRGFFFYNRLVNTVLNKKINIDERRQDNWQIIRK